MVSLKLVLLFVCVLIGICQVESGEIIDRIKGGFNSAYNGARCGFHKLKQLVKPHEHDVDPCSGKSRRSTEKYQEVDGNTEYPQIYNDEKPKVENTYGWRV